MEDLLFVEYNRYIANMIDLIEKNKGDPQFLEEIRTLFHQRLYVLFWVGLLE